MQQRGLVGVRMGVWVEEVSPLFLCSSCACRGCVPGCVSQDMHSLQPLQKGDSPHHRTTERRGRAPQDTHTRTQRSTVFVCPCVFWFPAEMDPPQTQRSSTPRCDLSHLSVLVPLVAVPCNVECGAPGTGMAQLLLMMLLLLFSHALVVVVSDES